MKKLSTYSFEITVTQYVTSDDIHALMQLAIHDGCASDWCVFRNPETMRKVSATSAAKILLDGGELCSCDIKDQKIATFSIMIGDILNGISKFIELGYDKYELFGRRPFGGENRVNLLTKTEVNHIIHLAAFGKPFGS